MNKCFKMGSSVLAGLLICSLSLPVLAAPATTSARCFGDVDGNGVVSATDALAILNHATNIEPLTDATALEMADTNGDGVINASDALYVLEVAARMKLPEVGAITYGTEMYSAKSLTDAVAKTEASITSYRETEETIIAYEATPDVLGLIETEADRELYPEWIAIEEYTKEVRDRFIAGTFRHKCTNSGYVKVMGEKEELKEYTYFETFENNIDTLYLEYDEGWETETLVYDSMEEFVGEMFYIGIPGYLISLKEIMDGTAKAAIGEDVVEIDGNACAKLQIFRETGGEGADAIRAGFDCYVDLETKHLVKVEVDMTDVLNVLGETITGLPAEGFRYTKVKTSLRYTDYNAVPSFTLPVVK